MRAIWNVQARDPGFRADGVLTLRTALPLPRYEPDGAPHRLLLAACSVDVSALPGVSHAAYITAAADGDGAAASGRSGIDGDLQERTAGHTASMRFATPRILRDDGHPDP